MYLRTEDVAYIAFFKLKNLEVFRTRLDEHLPPDSAERVSSRRKKTSRLFHGNNMHLLVYVYKLTLVNNFPNKRT